MTRRFVVSIAGLFIGCAGASAEGPPPEAAVRTTRNGDTTISFSQGVVRPPAPGTSVDLSSFEVRADEADRFVHCPPAGDLGQGWIPPIPAWTPPATSSAQDAPAPQAPPEMQGQLPLTRTEKALQDTRSAFRDCYHRGLVHDPTQDGHVAVVLRLDRDGKVARAETYGACGLQPEVLRCMREVGSRLRFAPPAAGDETVVLPVVFAPRAGSPHFLQSNDGYTAAAFLAFEALRSELHACEASARRSGRRIDAFGTFTIEIDPHGRVTTINVDPYGGEQSILNCAAETVQKLQLPPPQGGRATLVARLMFNPRR
jgi:hypothetical protein